ncbi:hypothetical protein ACFSQT_10185 [Mesorhizobium calcicola]|uniref:Uncharacterized protein n=1 Tax=Mesorhizobium calcicola TaxID=1300310 RepID=A0ABW4WAK8_9HYPH
MADQKAQVDAQQLASILIEAKIRLDDAVAHLRSPADKLLRVGRALEDNNTSCNTACTCGALADQISQPER